ncbi:hypothetical protein [Spirosoma utsteinense]|uniref:Transposase n=1 Tax=Spirosoma utsteinense TaxID=2585773 RepID=A0ABR6W5K6_9BACT|nr:hypothetical protein [Spirosoma utsteinense]MBC3786218.1 transposase [Spirosoma utsteinense]MBC3791844.1 transposase [Spirosoma utsteinense]
MKLLYLIGLLVITSAAAAQDSTIALRKPARVVIKFAPLSLLFDQDATLQGALEFRTGIRTAVQAEFGYGWRTLSPFDSDLKDFVDAEVWRGRAEVRFYTNRYRTNRRQGIAIRSDFPLGNYWAIDGLFKQINVVDRDYAYQPVFDSAAPRYHGLARTSRYALGSHLKIGRQFAFYDPHNRLFSRTLIDIYIGAGVRWAINDRRSASQNPSLTCGCGIGRSFTATDGQWTPSLAAGLKVGFAR